MTHPDDRPVTALLLTGASPDRTLAALRRTTLQGWTLWATAGAWTPPEAGTYLGAEREEEAGTAVLLSLPRRALAQTYRETLRGLLGERSVGLLYLGEAASW